MTHFVIVGNGVAGIEAALTIRGRHSAREARITVISEETDYFFSRTALMYAFMDMMQRRDLEPYERGMYRKQGIDLVRDRVVDIDSAAHTLTLRDGKQLRYDKLLLAVGAKPRRFPWKGLDDAKDGVVSFVSMQDLDACERLTPSTQRAVVIGGGLIGIELVESLHFHKVDVTFLVREPWYWPMALGEEEGDMVSEHIREHGVDLRLEEEMDEVQTDANGRVSGVLTNKGDSIPCQMLGLCVGVASNSDWLEDTKAGVERGRGIVVDDAFRTSAPDIWAAGDCVEIHHGADRPLVETIWYSAKRHGRMAALSMLGDTVEYAPPLFFNSSKLFEIEYTTVGDVLNVADATSLYRRHPTKMISQRIVYDRESGRVLGFNMLGSRWNHNVLEAWVNERRSIAFVKEHLSEAQFDVEFGRARLEQFEETELMI